MLALLGATAASSQVVPQPGLGDRRLQIVNYSPDQIVLIQAAPGYQVSLELAADELIETVALGDSGAWQVSAARGGAHLFVKPTMGGTSTNMTVVTNARIYAFELRALAGPSPDMAYTVQFRYPVQPLASPPAGQPSIEGRYRLSGARSLRPARISDDGQHTYIEWPEDLELPAVYALDSRGREMLVNGMMRDGIFVVDSVNARLVFRIDRQAARAERVKPGKAS
ncbi:MAG: TrbG/VirB9 family P-type conjugative transfer protein [Pseudomonadota bacterium]